ncbi:helix-turn-helix transcriptional regulator [Sphingomonas oleivorans]|uniref:Helix-turn-helix transcriptional regulator n=1 Tax=Sphingomonas oleivorans TaxID=1735121 RepID=A0A2T5G024_9SPHN|nr:helix-turn-helix transcriptional regulator [Sphingomonas oleivorans]PTQ12288.1 helix-turn-helix transcriptional regulator [Sphingomonas oleivorans]
MGDDRLDKLTDGQRACLRMVFAHMSSKEIARELKISSHTVDQRLRSAMQLLSVASRVEAARLLAAHEGAGAYQSSVYQPPYIAPAAEEPMIGPSVDQGAGQQLTGQSDAVKEEQLAYEAAPAPTPPKRGYMLPIPTSGRKRNDLDWKRRLTWIVAIAMLSALSFGMLLAGLDALSRLV